MRHKSLPRPSLDGGLLLVRLVAYLAAISLSRAQSNTLDKRADLCKDVRKLVSSADPILLDADAVSTVDGGIQHVLDCLPQRAAIQFSLAELKLSDTLHIKRAVSIEGLGTSIPCLDGSTQPIIDVRSDDVLLAGFSFAGCNISSTSGLVQVKGSRNVTLRDMVFENNANSVGPSCVSAIESTMQLQNITALNNKGVHGGAMSFVEASEIAILDSFFESNHANEQGGAIHMHNSNLDLSSSRFSENLAFDDGGAIFAAGELGSEVDMRDVEFAGNQAYGEYRNDSNSRAGGGIAFVGSKLNARIVGGTFVNNSAIFDGGAISAFNGTKVFIQDGAFLENVAYQGGSIHVQSYLPNVTHLELDGCNFTRNHAKGSFEGFQSQGGAISLSRNGTEATLKNCTFMENTAATIGGALFVSQTKKIDILASQFLRNGVGQVGLPMPSKGPSVEIDDATVFAAGGGVYVSGVPQVSIMEATFIENHAIEGGGLVVNSGSLGEAFLRISKSTFVENSATGSSSRSVGGAVALLGQNLKFSVRKSVFEENQAGARGGAVFTSGIASLELSGCSFEGNFCGVHLSQRQPRLPSQGSSVAKSNGGAVLVFRVPQVSIVEATFIKNRASRGGGLVVNDGNLDTAVLEISGSIFAKNTATSDNGGAVALSGQKMKCSVGKSVFKENQAGATGGAVFTAGIASLELSGCSFEGNFCGVHLSPRQPRQPSQGSSAVNNEAAAIVTAGGGVHVSRVPQVSLMEATFVKNHANIGGGLHVDDGDLDTAVLEISGSIFAENTATKNFATGGAVALSGRKLKCSVKKSVFKENQAGAMGGAVFAGIASLELSGCSFEGNFCGVRLSPRKALAKDSETGTRNLDNGTTLGGAILLVEVPETVIINCSFIRNEAGSGGSMHGHNEERSLLRIESSVFSHNNAVKTGGAMLVAGEGMEASISGATFDNNTSGESGGGILTWQSILVIDKTQFRDNFSKVGGAIHLLSANGRITKSVFTGNIAEENGGAMAALGPHGVSLRVDSSVFSDNAATLGGGAVHLFQTECSIKRSKFERNKAGSDGGAIDGVSVEINISQCLFKNNTSSVDGGGIRVMNSVLLVKGTSFSANVAEYGGGVLILSQNGTTVTIERSEFTGNVGNIRGGAIYSVHAVARPILTINATVFSKEDVSLAESLNETFSGDISFEENSFLKTRDAKFKGNHAGTQGGALYFGGLNVEMEGDLFHNNSAGGSGGAIFLVEIAGSLPNVTIESGSFVANQGTLGGAIFLQNRDLNISHCYFRSNVARNGGGALHCEDLGLSLIGSHKDSLITVHSSDFSENKAGASHQGKEDIELTSVDGKGGAVLMSGLGLVSEFKTCTFSNNAAGSGGAVHVQDVKQLNLTDSDFRRGSAVTGGALTIRSTGKTLAASNVSFVGNAARWGGAISLGSSGGITFGGISEGPDSLTQARFLENMATRGGGAIDLKERLLLCESCVFDSNSVGDDRDEFGSGGAIRAQSAANLTLANSTIMGCTATQSGGGLSLEDTIFFGENVAIVNNTAVNDGGGLAVHFPADIPWKCSSCSINGNKAGKGGGISISASKALLRDCQASQGSSVRSQHQRFELLVDCQHPLYDPDSLGHRVVLNNTTFEANRAQHSGSHIFLSDFKSDICCDDRCWNVASELNEGLQKCGLDEPSSGAGRELPSLGTLFESVLVLPDSVTGHPSGRELPLINITLLDSFGQIAADNVTLRVEVTTPGGELFGNPATSEGVLMSGGVTLTGIVMRALPDKYNLSIQLTSEDGKRTVSKRMLVEIRECEVGEVSQEEGFRCDKCPTDFFSFDVTDDICTPCPVEKARCAGGRLAPLDGFWHSHPQSPQLHACLSEEACTFPNRTEVLFASSSTSTQGHPQCAKGYRDVLCGSCETSHGRRRFQCSECRGGVPAGLGIGVVMLALAVLSLIYVKSAAKYSEGVLRTQSGVSSASGSQGKMVDQDMQGQHRNSPHGKRRSSNIFKILVNFFQVTGSAAAINVGWTEGMLMLFTTSDLASGVGDSSSFFSLECTFSSGKNGLPRSIQTSIFLAILPLIVWAVLVAFHYGHAVWKKKSFQDIKLWSSIALLAVQQASYISVTRTLVRIFSCVGASPRKGLFWVEDTSVVCYEGSHAFLVGFVGAPGLLLISIGFPSWILFKLTRGAKTLEQEGSVRRYGFLYQAYKKNVAAWEVVILVRKALLAAIVVFGRTLGKGVQANLALFVMLGSILLQTHFQPFLETKLNTMELGSLAISTVAFIIGNLVDQPEVSDGGKLAMSVVFIGGVVIYVAYMLREIFHVVLSELSEWIEKENPGVALPTSSFGLLVIATKSLTKKVKDVFQEKKVALVKRFSSNSSSNSRV